MDIQRWMQTYIDGFLSGAAEHDRNIDLKREHSQRVQTEISTLAHELGMRGRDLELAGVMGLLHDIGRFEQYARYGTFRDSHSEDHAALGMQVLQHHNLLAGYPAEEQQMILTAISHHNRASIPADQPPRQLRFTRLLRDADKLDIWKVVTDYYSRGTGSAEDSEDTNGAIELGLPDTPGVSDAVYRDLLQRRVVQFDHMHNLNDFKLLQIGWVYDLNFAPSLRRAYLRGYIDKIRAVLPDEPRVDKIYSAVILFMEDACPVDGGLAGRERRLVL